MLAKDHPVDAAWLSADEAADVQGTIDAEQASVKRVKDYWAAFTDPRVILLCVQFFAWSVGIYGLNMWLPLITRQGSSLGMTNVGFLNAIPYLFGAAAMWGVSVLSDRLLIRRAFVWPFLFIGAAAFLGSYLAGPSHFWLAFLGLIIAGVCMYAPYGPFWAMTPEMISRNVIGESLALINTVGALGGFLGTLGVGRAAPTHRRIRGELCLSRRLSRRGRRAYPPGETTSARHRDRLPRFIDAGAPESSVSRCSLSQSSARHAAG